MSLRDLAASALSTKKAETPSVSTQGDGGSAVSRVYSAEEAKLLTEDDLLRGWLLDPAEWAIRDGSLVANRWTVTAFAEGEKLENWNFQYKASFRKRVELTFAELPTQPKGCARCNTRKTVKRSPDEHDFDITYHVVIGDTQVRPGEPTDHLMWIGRYIRDSFRGRKTKIIHLGDHWDMPSVSSYTSKAEQEGGRVKDDLGAGNRAFEVLDEAMGDDHLWEKHFLFGNHEERILRYVNDNPPFIGFLSLDNCVTPEGWQRHGYKEILTLDGIGYSHFFYHPNTSKPYTGTVESRIKEIGHSFVMGHQQGLAVGMHYAAGKRRIGVVCGSAYPHDEGYKGPQGNHHFRGIVVLNDVGDGSADPMPVSLDYLCRRYEGHRLSEHVGVVL